MSPKILITGGSGLLALNWARCIRDRWDVILGLHRRRISMARTQACQIDLESHKAIVELLEELRPQLVVHTVALTNVDQCEREPELAGHVNLDLAVNVARACAQCGIKLVHVSTDHLFAGDVSWADEDWTVSPRNVYARTKAEAEVGVLEHNPSSLVVRTNFYGWGTRYRTSFSDFILQSLRTGKTLNLFDDVFYNPILIDSLVDATHELLEKGARGIFHVVGDERISKYDFGLKLAAHFELDAGLIRAVSIREQPQLVSRPRDMSLSNRKARLLLGRPVAGLSSDIDGLYRQENQGVAEELAQL